MCWTGRIVAVDSSITRQAHGHEVTRGLSDVDQTDADMASTLALASPNNMRVFSLKIHFRCLTESLKGGTFRQEALNFLSFFDGLLTELSATGLRLLTTWPCVVERA